MPGHMRQKLSQTCGVDDPEIYQAFHISASLGTSFWMQQFRKRCVGQLNIGNNAEAQTCGKVGQRHRHILVLRRGGNLAGG